MDGNHHPKNKTNDLTGKQWIQMTKSVWMGDSLPRGDLKRLHPATFAEGDVEKLIRMFTKRGMCVLDPFCGVASTLVACLRTQRRGVGVELSEEWARIGVERLAEKQPIERWISGELEEEGLVRVIVGDSRELLPEFESESFDFVVTSPPYWGILSKPLDHKAKQERANRGLATNYGSDPRDLGNIESYEAFLGQLGLVFGECHRLIRSGKYLAVFASDFRHGGEYYLFPSDVAHLCKGLGYTLKGKIVLVQDHKTLYPYGYPFDFVPNVHHQEILVFRKVCVEV
jgi:DNA modification methylase